MDSLLLATALTVGLSIGFLVMGLCAYIIDRGTWLWTSTKRVKRIPPGERGKVILRGVHLPNKIRDRWGSPAVGSELLHAGLSLEGGEYAALRWLSLWGGILAAVLVMIFRKSDLLGGFLASLGILVGFLGPGIWLKVRVERRRAEVDLALPDLLDRLSLGLNAGLSFESAFSRTARAFPGKFGAELREVVNEWDLGHTRASTLSALAARRPADSLTSFVAAVNQADELGNSLSETLKIQSGLLRSQRRRRAEEASRRLPILIAFPLVFFFLPALLIIYLVPPLLMLFFGP